MFPYIVRLTRLLPIICLMLLLGEARSAVLLGKFVPTEPGANTDLTSAGALDWIHWGLDSTNSNRKSGVSPSIGELTVIGESAAQQMTNSVQFNWIDGTPFTTASNVTTSVAVFAVTNGFSVTIPANTGLFKLRIYAGVYAAEGQLEVLLNDQTVPPYVDVSLDSILATNGFYLIDCQANSDNDVLTVRFTATTLHETNGYITLQAVALTTNAAPSVALTSPANETNLFLGSETLVSASALDSDGSIAKVEFFTGGTNKIGEATNAPFQVLWTNANVGPDTVTAVATDNNGAQSISAPITIFVTTTNGALATAFATAPANVNLTTEGLSDWVHWGLFTENSVDRKAGVVSQISNFTFIGQEPAYNFADGATGYTWNDGNPNGTASGTLTGIYIVGLDNGFQLTLPADPNPRTLKLYLGSYGSRGKFTATLSDYSAPVFISRSIDNIGNGPTSVYTMNYASVSNGQTLTITFTCDHMYDGYGNVTLQSATLVSSVNPLSLSLASPANDSVFTAPATIELQASLSGGDGSPRKVEFSSDINKLGEATSAPYNLNWNSVVAGNYSITARTTNSLGVIQTSDPVRVFVVGTGGIIAGRFDPSSGSVNLSTEGTQDWAHWGLTKKTSFNRKINSAQQISNFIPLGPGRLNQFGDNSVSYNWTNGAPTLSMSGTTTGVYIDQLGSGFEISIPADRTLRRLKFFAGLFAARGEIVATLSDFSAPPFVHSSFQNVFNNAAGVYTIEYAAASPGQTLTVTYISKTLFDVDYGNVTLEAATLQSISPMVNSMTIENGSEASFSFTTEPNWNYFIEVTASLSPPNWVELTNVAGTGATMLLNESTLSRSNRFYRLRMSK